MPLCRFQCSWVAGWTCAPCAPRVNRHSNLAIGHDLMVTLTWVPRPPPAREGSRRMTGQVMVPPPTTTHRVCVHRNFLAFRSRAACGSAAFSCSAICGYPFRFLRLPCLCHPPDILLRCLSAGGPHTKPQDGRGGEDRGRRISMPLHFGRCADVPRLVIAGRSKLVAVFYRMRSAARASGPEQGWDCVNCTG